MGLEVKNDINSTGENEGVKCPLVDFNIDESKCLENAMAVSGFLDEIEIIDKFKQKSNWREICKNCKNYSF